MSIRILLWDVDDTLLAFPPAEAHALKQVLAARGVEMTEALFRRYSALNKRFWEALERGELSRDDVLVGRFSAFFSAEGIPCDDPAAVNRAYQLAQSERVFLQDDALALLGRIKGKLRQYAVTNGTAATQARKLRLSGLDQTLDGVFISELVGAEKPDLRFFRHVLAEIGPARPEEIAIIGDSLTSDMLGGNRAGLNCWWYNPAGKPNDRGVRIDRELRDLRQVEALLFS